MITYPLEPSQVSLISMYTIGIPAFFLALQPNRDIIKGHFLTNVFLKALPAGLTDVLAVGALVVFGQTFGVASKDISTAATMLLAIVGFMILYRICQPMNALRMIVWIGCVIGLLGCSIFLPQFICDYGDVQKMHYAFCNILYCDRAGTSVSDEADRMAEKAVHKIYQESNSKNLKESCRLRSFS